MEFATVKPMIEQNLTRTQRRTEEMRRTIVEIASAILAEGGAAALSAEEVARRADVAPQTVYNRVGGKAALLAAATESALLENRRHMEAAYAAPGSPIERILRAGDAYRRFALEQPAQFLLLASPPDDPEAAKSLTALVAEMNGKLERALRDGIASGEIRGDIDAAAMATALWGMFNGMLTLAVRNDAFKLDEATRDKVLATATLVLEAGLAATQRQPAPATTRRREAAQGRLSREKRKRS
jgi:AcrR family transcriptional regulator